MSTAGDGGTRPLPQVGRYDVPGSQPAASDEQPTTVIGRVADRRTTEPQQEGPVVADRGLRGIEVVSGLLGGGLLLAGLVLLVLQFAAPSLVTAGRGPGWAAVAAHLGVGVVAEILRALRGRFRPAVRWTVSVLVILAAVGVLLLIWW